MGALYYSFSLVLTCFFLTGCHEDRMIPVAQGIYLSWDGIEWCVLDGRHRSKVGNTTVAGGVEVACKISTLSVFENRLILGQDDAGRFFIWSIEDPDNREVEWFDSKERWLEACSLRKADSPQLRSVTEFK